MSIIVSDTSPIRALAHLGHMELLRDLFGRVIVPPAVDQELKHPPARFAPIRVLDHEFITIECPHDATRVGELMKTLDPGESEALALALELGISAILIDEAAGRGEASRLGLRPVGVLGVLVRARQRSLIERVAPLINDLESELGFFVSPRLRTEILRLSGEEISQ